jgi:hypothetical protein
MPDYRVKISDKSDHHTSQNLSSNPTDKKSKIDNKSNLKSYKLNLIRNLIFDGKTHESFNKNLKFISFYVNFKIVIRKNTESSH